MPEKTSKPNIKIIPKINSKQPLELIENKYVELLESLGNGLNGDKYIAPEGILHTETLLNLAKYNPKLIYINIADSLWRWNFWHLLPYISDEQLTEILKDIPDHINEAKLAALLAQELLPVAEMLGEKHISEIKQHFEKEKISQKITTSYSITRWSERQSHKNYDEQSSGQLLKHTISPEFQTKINETKELFLHNRSDSLKKVKNDLLVKAEARIKKAQPKLSGISFEELINEACKQYILEECRYYDCVTNTDVVYPKKVPPALEVIFNKCDLIVMAEAPDLKNFSSLSIPSNAAYIRAKDQLIYINKKLNECVILNLDSAALIRFDLAMQTEKFALNQSKSLSNKQLYSIQSITDHAHKRNLLWREISFKKRNLKKLQEEKMRLNEITTESHELKSTPKPNTNIVEPTKINDLCRNNTCPSDFKPTISPERKQDQDTSDEKFFNKRDFSEHSLNTPKSAPKSASLAERRAKFFPPLQIEQRPKFEDISPPAKETQKRTSSAPVAAGFLSPKSENSLLAFVSLYSKTPPSEEKSKATELKDKAMELIKQATALLKIRS